MALNVLSLKIKIAKKIITAAATTRSPITKALISISPFLFFISLFIYLKTKNKKNYINLINSALLLNLKPNPKFKKPQPNTTCPKLPILVPTSIPKNKELLIWFL